MNICKWCGQEGKYQFKNGIWCCENHYTKCPVNKLKHSEKMKGRQPWNKNKKCCYTEESINKMKLSHLGHKDSKETIEKKRKASTGRKHSIETKNKLREINKGNKLSKKVKSKISSKIKNLWGNENSIYHRKEWKERLSINLKRSIEKININYPLFSKIEEMRYNPDKPEEKEIQVHCKNNNCPNSKEKGGWFTPSSRQIEARISKIENDGVDLSYFYCSDECKNYCPLFYSRGSDPFKNHDKPYTESEYQIFRNYVLERDNHICQYCGKLAEHVHHERPQKLEPFHSLDPDLAWSVCSECHYKYGHKDECSTGSLSNKNC